MHGAALRVLPVLALAGLAACTVGPDFVPPKAAVPASYLPSSEKSAVEAAPAAPVAAWWRTLRSDRLDALVDQAIVDNPSIAAAEARLLAGQEDVAATSGALYPQATLSGGVGRNKINLASFGFRGPNPVLNFYSLGPSVSYALDVFGGIRRRVEGQKAALEVDRQQLAAAHLVLAGQVASAAVTVAAARAELAALDDIVANDKRNLALVKTAQAVGTGTRVEVLSAASQLANDETLLPPVRQQLSIARHALAVLIGKAPGDWSPPDFDLAEFFVPTPLPLAVPSALVHQRPDILAAEAALHVANADIGVATAQLYPSITLTAAIAQGATKPNLFFSGASTGWNLGSGLVAPIFNGGTLRAKRRGAIDLFNASLDTYRQTIVQAFGQVADSLAALQHDGEEHAAQAAALDAADTSLALAREAYSAGQSSILQVLDAQRQYQQARLGLVHSQAQILADTISVLVATGSAETTTP
jgi:NodT family efflux transporter outer membrane factor (OMF) lipoprotein